MDNRDHGDWLVGWSEIARYIGKSARTAQRYWRNDGLPVLRDCGGRPIALREQINKFIIDMNRRNFQRNHWNDEGIETAMSYLDEHVRKLKDFEEKFLHAQRRPRGLY